jgi:hypothetical protein
MNIEEAIIRAIQEPTLIDALTWICVWEHGQAPLLPEPCYRLCIKRILDTYAVEPGKTVEPIVHSHSYFTRAFICD